MGGGAAQRGLWAGSAAVVILDQLVKALVRARLSLFESVPVVPGFASLTRVHNTGAAFGLLNTSNFAFKTVALALVAVGALVALGLYAASLPREQRLARAGLSLILGGAAGNLIDRVAAGYVLDFVDLYWRGWHFWAFNVADAAITVGVALMLLDILGLGRRDPARRAGA